MKEVSLKTKIELEKEIAQNKAELRKFRFEMSGSKVKDVRKGRALRREIARGMTAIRSMKK